MHIHAGERQQQTAGRRRCSDVNVTRRQSDDTERHHSKLGVKSVLLGGAGAVLLGLVGLKARPRHLI